MARLLTSVSAADEAERVAQMRGELARLRVDEQVRRDKRRQGGTLLESAASGALRPWRELIQPHRDVATGKYQQAEFAADLWQVHVGQGADEYRDPAEFFRRTYMTESLRRLLMGAASRLGGGSGDPVVQLQTNFGGGKTHSMLALYHLVSGAKPTSLPGVGDVMQDAGIAELPSARRVVLVGNKISPGNPSTKDDGTRVRTLWGELAWQLGESAGGVEEARRAYERIREDDERSTNPGDRLRKLFDAYGPCLVLIDEWVAYARQLHDDGDLPGGSFETQFTFAQALTESAKLAKNCLLVISLPASDTASSKYDAANDVEVGGTRGREALERLQNVIGRVESSWKPASAEESFEIVRRRLFNEMEGESAYRERDIVTKAFGDLYRTHAADFPSEASQLAYERRIQQAYPIHPEIFDRLYTDWSTLVKFQRTRGVLRLMAAVVHQLWEGGDRAPLILPASIPIDAPRVQFELTRYLEDSWTPIIEKDVDGPNSLPRQIDSEVPSLGQLAATRRVARTIYLGSAPLAKAANRGVEDRRVRLGSVLPGESPSVFNDALRRLAQNATYLYQDGSRYWYATQPTVIKLAKDKAEALRREPDRVTEEIEKRLRDDLRHASVFAGVHVCPGDGSSVADELETRLVVLAPEHCHTRTGPSDAQAQADAILVSRGAQPRVYKNALAFLAADKARLADLEDRVRWYLAWKEIVDEKTQLDLAPLQQDQAEAQRSSVRASVSALLPETYQWLLVPERAKPAGEMNWQSHRLSGQGPLAERAAKKLRRDDLMITEMDGSILKREIDRVPLWDGDHISLRTLVTYFASYLYLSRVAAPKVIIRAAEGGIAGLTWEHDGFAYAEGYDEERKRYRGLKAGERLTLSEDSSGLLVRSEAARAQLDAELAKPPSPIALVGPEKPYPNPSTTGPTPATVGETGPSGVQKQVPVRFHGAVELSAARAGLEASKIAAEVISHLTGQLGATVRVTLEIEASVPDGVPDHVVRTVTENANVLKFKQQGFSE